MASRFSQQVRALWQEIHSPTNPLTFPQTVQRLLQLGVTRYHVDYVTRSVTAYADGADSQTDVVYPPDLETVDKEYPWNIEKVKESIRQVQAGSLSYSQFSRGLIEGGVTNYWGYLKNIKVVYCSALGDFHVGGTD